MGIASAAATTSGNATLEHRCGVSMGRERGRSRGDPEHGQGGERRADRRRAARPVPHGGHQEPGDDRHGVAEHHLVDVPHRAGEIRRRADEPGVLRGPQRHAAPRRSPRAGRTAGKPRFHSAKPTGALADAPAEAGGIAGRPATGMIRGPFRVPSGRLSLHQRRRGSSEVRAVDEGAARQHLDVLLQRTLLDSAAERQLATLASTAANGTSRPAIRRSIAMT